jgi:hypothetical protein
VITDLKAKRLTRPMADGTVVGLRLEPSARGRSKWILRFVSPVTKRRRDMGLGTYPDVGIAAAREKGMEARRMIAQGKDPIEERKAVSMAVRGTMTFESAARAVHWEQSHGWKGHKHAGEWIATLQDYVFPRLGKSAVWRSRRPLCESSSGARRS